MYTSKKKYISDDRQTPFHLDVTSLAQFTACAVINTPLAFLWMNNLEANFPTYTAEQGAHAKKSDEKGADSAKPRKISVKNTIAKIVLDQTVGAAWVTILFLTTMGILRGQDLGGVMNTIQNVSFYHFFVCFSIFFYIWGMHVTFFWNLCRSFVVSRIRVGLTSLLFLQDFWPIMIAGLKLWPLVSILCFTVVPAEQRLLVGGLFGFVWAIYLSLMST
jgi:protein Mpv17